MRNKKGFIVTTLLIFGSITLIGAVTFIFLLYFFNNELQEKIQNKRLLDPTIFYGNSPHFKKGDLFDAELIKKSVSTFRSRTFDNPLMPEDFLFGEGENCLKFTSTQDITISEFGEISTIKCFIVHWPQLFHPHFEKQHIDTIIYSSENIILGIYSNKDITPSESDPHFKFQPIDDFFLPPKIIAQYLGEEPILYSPQTLSTYPTHCLNAVMAIEDSHFLEHKGVSVTGIARAFLKNIILQRKAQGGSTITQQLVKNYFLTSEKTLKRKFQEIFMALLLETKFEKDLILETYLNVIYMGQRGTYQIRGYGAASEYYFSKHINELNLQECSLMAAIVNSPGLFNPFTRAEKSKDRRHLVLQKMSENNFISENEFNIADNSPLPQVEPLENITSIPYFIQGVQSQLKDYGYDNLEGLSIYTTVNLDSQKEAQNSIQTHLEFLEANNKTIQKNLLTKNKKLESLLISIDVNSAYVNSLIGGRSFKASQFNRAISSQRQVGSTFKPLVYLTALMNDYDPLSVVHDTPFVYKERNQKWQPLNYSKTSLGDIPLFYALKESLNLPTAKLAIDLGIEKVIDTAKELGIDTDLPKVPSLSLGSFGINPKNMAQIYLNIARLGHMKKFTTLIQVQDKNKSILWNYQSEESDFKDLAAIQVLVGILKETARTGTAQQISKSGFIIPTAGKTGTTNDNKDTWFIGFTPETLTLVWTGYDDNTSTGLTGANGAVPIWLTYMNAVTSNTKKNTLEPNDFNWNQDQVEKKVITEDDLRDKDILPKDNKPFLDTELIFQK